MRAASELYLCGDDGCASAFARDHRPQAQARVSPSPRLRLRLRLWQWLWLSLWLWFFITCTSATSGDSSPDTQTESAINNTAEAGDSSKPPGTPTSSEPAAAPASSPRLTLPWITGEIVRGTGAALRRVANSSSTEIISYVKRLEGLLEGFSQFVIPDRDPRKDVQQDIDHIIIEVASDVPEQAASVVSGKSILDIPWHWMNAAGNSYGVWSLSIHLLACLALLVFASTRQYTSSRRRFIWLFALTLIAWVYLIAIERNQRHALVRQVELSTLRKIIHDPSELNGFESSIWLNVLLAKVWVASGGGLGPYLSDIVKQTLVGTLELTRPMGIGQCEIKQFHLGKTAPVIRKIKTSTARGVSAEAKLESYEFDHVTADLDVAFVSDDMNVAVEIRSADTTDTHPIATLVLSDLSIHGMAHANLQLLPSYPFFGNATVSFASVPELDFSLTLPYADITALPGMRRWLNLTLAIVLQQYTYPNYVELDLKHTICPTCDVPAPITEDPNLVTQVLAHLPRLLGKGCNIAQKLFKTLRSKFDHNHATENSISEPSGTDEDCADSCVAAETTISDDLASGMAK